MPRPKLNAQRSIHLGGSLLSAAAPPFLGFILFSLVSLSLSLSRLCRELVVLCRYAFWYEEKGRIYGWKVRSNRSCCGGKQRRGETTSLMASENATFTLHNEVYEQRTAVFFSPFLCQLAGGDGRLLWKLG